MKYPLEIPPMPLARLWIASASLLVVLSFVATSFAANDDDLPVPDAKTAGEIRVLIRSLGDESYSAREAATEKLLTYGLPALKIVEEGTKDADREIRYRCDRVRVLLREIDLQRRLEAFAADVKGEKDHGLPAWNQFSKLHGGTAEARQLFVDIFKAEPDLLKKIQFESSTQVADFVSMRVFQLMQQQQMQQQISIGSLAGLLFVAADKDISLIDQTQQYIFNFCYQQSLRDAMSGPPEKQAVVRSLLGKLMSRAEGNVAYQALYIGMQFEMKESLDVARRMIDSRGAGNQHMMQIALPAMAKLGTVDDLPAMEELLEDKTVLFNFQQNNQRIECQIRDYALVSVLHLLAKSKDQLKGTPLESGDLKAFGFDRLEPNPTQLYNPQSIGFISDDKRQEAFKKWNDAKAQIKEKLPKPKAGTTEKNSTSEKK